MSLKAHNGTEYKDVKDIYVHNGNSFKKCYRMFVHNGTEFKLVKGVSFKRVSQWFAAPSDAGSDAQKVKASYPKCLAINEYGQALITRSGNYLGSGNAPKTQQSIIRYSHNDTMGVDFQEYGISGLETNGHEVDFFIPYAQYGAVAREDVYSYTSYFGGGTYATSQRTNALLSNKKFDTFDKVIVDLTTYSADIKDMFIYYLSNVRGNIYVFKECFAKYSNYVYPLSNSYVTSNFNVNTAGIVDVEKNFSLITTKYAPPTQNTLVFQNIRNTGQSWYHIWRITPSRSGNTETNVATIRSDYTNANNTYADEALIYLTNTHFFCAVKLHSQWYITKRSFTNNSEIIRIKYPASYEHPYFHTDWENQEALYRHCPKITIENREGFILPNGNIVMCDTMEVIPPPFFLPIPTHMLADGAVTRVAKIAYNDEIGEGYIAYVYHFSAGNELGYYYDRFRRIDAQ